MLFESHDSYKDPKISICFSAGRTSQYDVCNFVTFVTFFCNNTKKITVKINTLNNIFIYLFVFLCHLQEKLFRQCEKSRTAIKANDVKQSSLK